jgi:uncharacterized NAD(P)/FAD-binding protein YdhS
MATPDLRVAIVGLGPKGLFALERLLDHTGRGGARASLDVDVFEPHPAPGAGPVYDPRQPAYLRMNIAADQLNLWSADNAAVPPSERLAFTEWRRSQGPVEGLASARYPPRALVGRYLADGFERIRRRVPRGMRLALLPLEVRAAHTDGTSWTVVAADGSTRVYDEVLVTVGHGTGAAPAEPESWPHAASLIPGVFPVARWLTADRVPPGSAAVVRGFALTFLDAALALTEGRGGAFEADAHPHRLRYVPGAGDVGVILPVSRTGRPMLAKPQPELAASVPELEEIARSGSERVLALPEGLDLRVDLLPILADAVAANLLAANPRRPEGERPRRVADAARDWLSTACDGFPPVAAHHAADDVERSLDVGSGLRPPDLPWALGHTWQSLYPALVERLGGTGLSHRAWPAFRRLAAEMERVAFGPPPVNAAKLLALIGAGTIDLDHVRGSRITTTNGVTSIGAGHARRTVDVVVNAVLPGPGVRDSGPGLLERLTADGHARVAPRRRGLEVTRDAACVGRDGRRTPGLSAAGRATEDWVIGNDTLNRSLHPHLDRWAQRIVRAHRAGLPRDEAA